MRVKAVSFELPEDFPGAAHDAALGASWSILYSQDALIPHVAGSLNAIAYRFRALHDYSSAFADGVAKMSDRMSDRPEGAYEMGHALYGFFASAYSAVDSCAYWLYSIGTAKWPASFPFLRPPTTNERSITLKSTIDGYASVPAGGAALMNLQSAADSAEYRRIRAVRNVLSHRVHPGRSINLFAVKRSGEKPPPDEMTIAGEVVRLEPAMLTPYRAWLAGALNDLLSVGTTTAAT